MKQTVIYVDDEFRTRLASDSRKALAPCWAIHEVLPSYPKATGDVLQLLATMGWDCLPKNLFEFIKTAQFTPPRKVADLLAWQAQDISRLIFFLDKKRLWLVGFHIDQKTEIENRRDEAEASKGLAMLAYYQRMPRRELEHRLAEAQTSPSRELISAAMRLQRCES